MRNISTPGNKYLWAYGFAWMLLGSVYASLLVILATFSWGQAMTEAWLFTILYAIMGIAIWNIVKFSGLGSRSLLNTLITHVVAAALLVFIIVTGAEKILANIFTESGYLYMFNTNHHLYRLLGGLLLYAFMAINFYLIVYYEEYRSRKLRQAEVSQHLKTAELNMLKSQINPHFIFNSLNSISSLTLTAPEKAHEMVLKLADFLRYSIRKDADELVSLEQEIKAMELFLDIERIRFGKRLQVKLECNPPALEAMLPVLVLQPLIENAIKYSLHETEKDSVISIACEHRGQELLVRITNTYDPDTVAGKGEGIGLANVRSRLAIIYARQDLLEIIDENNTFTVNLLIPQL